MKHCHALHRHLVRKLGAVGSCGVEKSDTIIQQVWIMGLTCLGSFSADLSFTSANEGVVQNLQGWLAKKHQQNEQN